MEELLRHRLQSLTPEHRAFVVGDYIPQIASRFAKAENFDSKKTDALITQLRIFTLGFYTTDELTDVLTNLLGLEYGNTEILVSGLLQAFPDEYIIALETFKAYIESAVFFDPELEIIATKHHIVDPADQVLFSNIVQNIVAGHIERTALPRLMQYEVHLDQATSMRITGDILDFLDTKRSDNTKTPLSNTEQTVTQSLAAELAETEAAFKQIQPIRTMAHDMETLRAGEEPAYKAADQDTLLNGDGNAQKKP